MVILERNSFNKYITKILQWYITLLVIFDVTLTATNACPGNTFTRTAYVHVTGLTNPTTFTSTSSFTVPPMLPVSRFEAWGAGGGGTNARKWKEAVEVVAATPRVHDGESRKCSCTVGVGGAAGSAVEDSSVGTIVANGGGSMQLQIMVARRRSLSDYRNVVAPLQVVMVVMDRLIRQTTQVVAVVVCLTNAIGALEVMVVIALLQAVLGNRYR
jgi:hypothetical protein